MTKNEKFQKKVKIKRDKTTQTIERMYLLNHLFT